jgi:hypothetical protein
MLPRRNVRCRKVGIGGAFACHRKCPAARPAASAAAAARGAATLRRLPLPAGAGDTLPDGMWNNLQNPYPLRYVPPSLQPESPG